jgi:glycerol-3-phosphate acyltransferase PlsX
VADFIFGQLRTSLTSKLHYKMAALVLKPALLAMRSRLDYGEYGGAPLLGVDGIVTIAHGRADATAIRSALRATREAVASGMLDGLRERFAGAREARGAVGQSATSGSTATSA